MVLVNIAGVAVCLHVDPCVAVVVTGCDRSDMAVELTFNSDLVVGQNLLRARAGYPFDVVIIDGGVGFDSLIKLAASFTSALWSRLSVHDQCQLR